MQLNNEQSRILKDIRDSNYVITPELKERIDRLFNAAHLQEGDRVRHKTRGMGTFSSYTKRKQHSWVYFDEDKSTYREHWPTQCATHLLEKVSDEDETPQVP